MNMLFCKAEDINRVCADIVKGSTDHAENFCLYMVLPE
jgi:hypothetical protein